MSTDSNHGTTRVVVAALAGNAAIAISKFVAAYFSQSAAMLAEAIHSVSDSGNQILLLVGMRLAARPATDRHPFGRDAERYFWPFLVSLVLFLGGGLFALYEGYHKMRHPGFEPTGRQLLWAYGVLGTSVLFEIYSFSVALREFRREHSGRAVKDIISESRDMTVPLVLMEDTAALVGLMIALIGIGASQFVHAPWIDGAASMAIGVVLCGVAAVIARQTHTLLIGAAASTEDRRTVETIVAESPRVLRVVEMLSLHVGPDDVIVALKVAFDPEIGLKDLEEVINEIERRIRAKLPRMRRIFIEPDSVGDASSAAGAPVAAPTTT